MAAMASFHAEKCCRLVGVCPDLQTIRTCSYYRSVVWYLVAVTCNCTVSIMSETRRVVDMPAQIERTCWRVDTANDAAAPLPPNAVGSTRGLLGVRRYQQRERELVVVAAVSKSA